MVELVDAEDSKSSAERLVGSSPAGGTTIIAEERRRPSMLERRDNYDALYRDFRWKIPQRFNIGVAVVGPLGGRRPGPRRASRLSRRRRAGKFELRRAFGAVECAWPTGLQGARRPTRRPRRAAAAAMFRDGDRACRDLQARRDRGAAGAAVRRRGARVPAADRRREGGRHQPPRATPRSRRSAAGCPASNKSS